MGSLALSRWATERRDALSRLEAIHTTLTGSAVGRPRDVNELNHALFLRLASEVQGFCRDLLDESIDVMCSPANVPSTDLAAAFRTAMTTGRKLDSGNAGPGNLGSDWALLGMRVWADLGVAHPGPRGKVAWNSWLEWLNTARNGIAHNDPAQIAKARAAHPLTLRTFRTARARFNRFAIGLDAVTGAYLRQATGTAPW